MINDDVTKHNIEANYSSIPYTVPCWTLTALSLRRIMYVIF